MAQQRQRLNSMSDHSSPSSDASENSEALDLSDLRLNLETTSDFSDCERQQIESAFNALGTEIYVSTSLANLYEGVKQRDWQLKYTGVPVLMLDKGSARSRNTPRISFILAERGTCFALWKDTIDNLSDYKITGPCFHTMCLSTDHTKQMGFSFDTKDSALEFWENVERLISDPENIALSAPGRKRKIKRPKAKPLPPKSQISLPCQFSHVTQVLVEDTARYYSLQAFVKSNQ
ncbi:unnamed protein product [Chironomus riparius]|uniref:WH1 domain-containing protein n=1 Tax=Chironomus riparius TaxID=315576 RepID=A0A9N9RKN8_9DIPT|nr:unnamed protein product [Chironomus riparius]